MGFAINALAIAGEAHGEVRQSLWATLDPSFGGDVRSRDGNDSTAGEIDAALREVSKSTLETENWYPEDSMELDAVLAQELGLVESVRCRLPEKSVLQAICSQQLKNPIMRLDVFLDEDVPDFPFAKVHLTAA
eukprot:symbB.v1.2.021670.t1/scaffold1886.1/size97136/9